MTDESLYSPPRVRRALERMRGYRGSVTAGPPGGLVDDLPPGNPSGPSLRIADRYAAGRKHG